MQFWLDYLPVSAQVYLYRLPPDQLQLGLNVAFGVFVLCGLLFAAYCFLRGLGWVRFQGTWYSPNQFRLVVQELYAGVKDGRVPDYETMKVLDRYVYGRSGSNIRNMTKADHI